MVRQTVDSPTPMHAAIAVVTFPICTFLWRLATAADGYAKAALLYAPVLLLLGCLL